MTPPTEKVPNEGGVLYLSHIVQLAKYLIQGRGSAGALVDQWVLSRLLRRGMASKSHNQSFSVSHLYSQGTEEQQGEKGGGGCEKHTDGWVLSLSPTRMLLRHPHSLAEDLLPTNEGHRARFYEHYHKESEEYDKEFIKKYDEDLNTTLIFVSIT